MRLLLLEDEPTLGRPVQEHLQLEGHQVAWARSIADAEQRLAAGPADMLLFDLRLPDGSGLDLLKALRSRGDQRPVIILTARDQVSDRILGLNAGADDYLVKPFDLAELSARIVALARRSVQGAGSITCADGTLQLDLRDHQARLNGAEVTLTAREWAVLEVLARRPGQLVSRERMEAALAGAGGEFDSNAVEVYVSRIRRKLGHGSIETQRGLGYRLRP